MMQKMQSLIIGPARSAYPTVEAYQRPGYELRYSPRLILTKRNYYGSKAYIPKGMRMSTAADELAIQLPYEIVSGVLGRIKDRREILGKTPDEIRNVLMSHAQTEREKDSIQYVFDAESEAIQHTVEEGDELIIDPRKAKVFDDLFARGPDKVYMWQLTETFLRVPKGKKNPGKPDFIDPKTGYKSWAREVGNGKEVSGVIYVPEGNERLVAEWDEVFGVPRVTIENMDWPHKPYTTHFHFNSTPDKDSKSGHYDVAVGRMSDWHLGGVERCLGVDANVGRFAGLYVGFRPVRGSAVAPRKTVHRLPVDAAIDAAVQRVLDQYGDDFGMPLLDFAWHAEEAADDVLRDFRVMEEKEFAAKHRDASS